MTEALAYDAELRERLYGNAAKGLGSRIEGPQGVIEFPAPTDISEHLPVLRHYASQCDHVTEMGMRWANGSTLAFLAAQPKSLISWDIDPKSVVSQRVATLSSVQGKTRFQPRVGDTLEINLEETDFLFVDTLHTAKHLWAEMERHSFVPNVWPPKPTVRKYIAFHDTFTFGMKGEDGSEPGLRAALRRFQNNAFPLWELIHDLDNCNGLIVFRRVDVKDHPEFKP